ncbi:MAG: hypothetical protein AB1523_00305 [Bacillota bacterium]
MNKLAFPQAGIITSLDAGAAKAKVFLPLFKIETGWIPVATNLLYQEQVTMKTPVLTADPLGTIEKPPKESPPPPDYFTAINAHAGTAEKISWGTLKVGDEVVVIFLNGDLNEGRVIARF